MLCIYNQDTYFAFITRILTIEAQCSSIISVLLMLWKICFASLGDSIEVPFFLLWTIDANGTHLNFLFYVYKLCTKHKSSLKSCGVNKLFINSLETVQFVPLRRITIIIILRHISKHCIHETEREHTSYPVAICCDCPLRFLSQFASSYLGYYYLLTFNK